MLIDRRLEALCGEWASFGGLVLGAPNGATNTTRRRLRGHCVPRIVLDDRLYRQAVSAGGEPLQAHVKDLAGLVEFDGVIDARGIRGGKPNAIAMRTCGDVPTSALGPGEGGLLQICFERYLGAGYGWIFPVIEVGG